MEAAASVLPQHYLFYVFVYLFVLLFMFVAFCV
jgi:hypothetical protein